MKLELIQLIQTLTPGEKRSFKLQCKKTETSSAYLDLYEIINQHSISDIDKIQNEFKSKHPKKSIDTTAQYLQQLISDALIKNKSQSDSQFKMYYGLMRSKIYFERSLPEEGYKELKKVQSLAHQSEHHLIQYYTMRMELNYLSNTGFENVPDTELYHLQTQSKSKLQLLRQIQEHHSLYELLKYRLLHSEKTQSKQNQKKLNDLILSELSLITRGKEKSFESQKLHLLFQSFFFTHSGDHKSGLKIFTQLNQLFEQHQHLLEAPPYDYLTTLEGILDSLNTLGQYHEMDYYLTKITNIRKDQKHQHFIELCHQIVQNYRLLILLKKGNFEAGLKYFNDRETSKMNVSSYQNFHKSEWLLYGSISYFKLKNWKKTATFLNRIEAHPRFALIQYKTVHLLNIINHYELNDLTYIEYAQRNYMRAARKSNFKFKLEKIIFNLLKFDPHRKSKPNKALYFEKLKPKLDSIESDKYELQIQHYFDFIDWIKNKLIGQ
ncbi:hypothetical protein [Membranihabitans marinus]|uniref:hypothetical protein n=1 Tax=Membranihabitans marinus TaxID=1227546 RepID=UPI001F202FB4|nr:hypothetical protein [Membranihabitans marinus]